jgi:4-hydroxybenzoate polyprenyltransferase
MVRPDDLSRVNEAFFNVNAIIGLVLLAAIAADLWW